MDKKVIDKKLQEAESLEDLKFVLDLMSGNSGNKKKSKASSTKRREPLMKDKEEKREIVLDVKSDILRRNESSTEKAGKEGIIVEKKNADKASQVKEKKDIEKKTPIKEKKEEVKAKAEKKEEPIQEDLSAYFDECIRKAPRMNNTGSAKRIKMKPKKVIKKMDKGEGFLSFYDVLSKKSKTIPPMINYDSEEGRYNLYLGSALLYSSSPLDIYNSDRKRIEQNLDKKMNTRGRGKNVDFTIYMLLDKYDNEFGTRARDAYLAKMMGIDGPQCGIKVNYDLRGLRKNKNQNILTKTLIEKYASIHRAIGIGSVQKNKSDINELEYEI